MNFKEWQKTAESIKTIDAGKFIRDIYPTPNKIELMHDYYFSMNIFKNSSEICYVSASLPDSMKSQVIEAGGKPTEIYDPEGYFTAMFRGSNCLEMAYNFSQTLNPQEVL